METQYETQYIITGAGGHLGRTIAGILARRDCRVRGLIRPGSAAPAIPGVEFIEGDVTDPESLEALFEGLDGQSPVLIHTAGIISIARNISPAMYRVNVEGTKNVIALCRAHGARMVYVSSVHALPEKPRGEVVSECTQFSPELVVGGYAKTKAEATAAVLEAAKAGLDAVVVHPSGIIGPGDRGGNHLNQMVAAYISGALPAGVTGGYDFVDVRDVALGCIAAAEKGESGQCYILSGSYHTIAELFQNLRNAVGGKSKPCLPMFLAKAAAPLIDLGAKILKRRPLFTWYSLRTLSVGCCFSHEKAAARLGFAPRPIGDTIADTVQWMRLNAPRPRRRTRRPAINPGKA